MVIENMRQAIFSDSDRNHGSRRDSGIAGGGHRVRTFGRSSTTVSADAAPRAAVVKVRRTPLSNTLSIAGEFLPYQEVELHAKVAGYIRNINVDIGDRVRTGQVLAVLEIPGTVRTSCRVRMRGCGTARRKSLALRMK